MDIWIIITFTPYSVPKVTRTEVQAADATAALNVFCGDRAAIIGIYLKTGPGVV